MTTTKEHKPLPRYAFDLDSTDIGQELKKRLTENLNLFKRVEGKGTRDYKHFINAYKDRSPAHRRVFEHAMKAGANPNDHFFTKVMTEDLVMAINEHCGVEYPIWGKTPVVDKKTGAKLGTYGLLDNGDWQNVGLRGCESPSEYDDVHGRPGVATSQKSKHIQLKDQKCQIVYMFSRPGLYTECSDDYSPFAAAIGGHRKRLVDGKQGKNTFRISPQKIQTHPLWPNGFQFIPVRIYLPIVKVNRRFFGDGRTSLELLAHSRLFAQNADQQHEQILDALRHDLDDAKSIIEHTAGIWSEWVELGNPQTW